MGATQAVRPSLKETQFEEAVKQKFFLKRSKFIDGANGEAQPKVLPDEPSSPSPRRKSIQLDVLTDDGKVRETKQMLLS